MMQRTTFSQANDYTFPTPLADSVSSLSVNGSASVPTNMVIAGSWDNTVTCFEFQQTANGLNAVVQSQIRHDAPVLCTEIASDNYTTFSAGCDGQIRMWNVTQGPQSVQVIGKHDQPVKVMKFLPEKNILITGSWDKTVKLWDCRTANPVHVYSFPERIYAMDAKQNALVIGCADKMIHIYDLSAGNAMTAYKSPLTYQMRTISVFSNCQGFAVGCIEGRVALDYFSEMQAIASVRNAGTPKPASLKSFVFKCHRHDQDIYAVNALDFYKNNSLVTAGSDGTFNTWDIENKQRLGSYELYKSKFPITCAKFNAAGNMLFYSLSYDWSKGANGNDKPFPNSIIMHPVNETEMTKRPPGTK